MGGFFSGVRIAGFSMFVAVLSLAALLIHQASKQQERNSWDSSFAGDLATEEGVVKMLSTGRENVMPSEETTKHGLGQEDSGYVPEQFKTTPRHAHFNKTRPLDTQSAL